jgi:hypothetical protein
MNQRVPVNLSSLMKQKFLKIAGGTSHAIGYTSKTVICRYFLFKQQERFIHGGIAHILN